MRVISYFNPFASDHQALQDFKKIEPWQKAIVVFATLLTAALSLRLAAKLASRKVAIAAVPLIGLSTIAVFRKLVSLMTSHQPPPTRIVPKVKPPAPIPEAKELTAQQIKKAQAEKVIQANLKRGQRLGKAIDNGDCFYHAIAQLLLASGIKASIESLRQDVFNAAQNPHWQAHLKKKFEDDPRGLGDWANYIDHVRYPHQQSLTDPLWGDPHREGVILCEKYHFNLRVISAGYIESTDESDTILQGIKIRKKTALKGLDEGTSDYDELEQKYETQIRNRNRELYNDPGHYYLEDTTVPRDAPYSRTLTLALYGDHFVPVHKEGA